MMDGQRSERPNHTSPSEQVAAADAASLFARAADLHRQGALDAAEILYRQILDADPDNFDSLQMLGVLEAQRGNLENAAVLLADAVRRKPDNVMAHYNCGNVLRDLKRLDEALASYDRALSLMPKQPSILLNRGVVLQELDRYDEALATYGQALSADFNNAAVHFNRGNSLTALRRYEEALQSYRCAITFRGDYAEAHNASGIVLTELGRPQEAIAAFDKAIALRADLVSAHEGKSKAIAQLNKRGGTFPKDLAGMQRAIGELSMEAGDIERATKHLEVAARLDPDDQTARYFLAAANKSPVPESSPPEYIAALFNQYADSFERRLVGDLRYQGHELLCGAVADALGKSPPALNIVDLGCGTGLCGSLIRAHASRLIGVDLSERMLENARKRGVYDVLIHGDATAAMEQFQAEFDVIIAADVLIYIGNLRPLFDACARAAKPGALFAFTVEAHDGSEFVLGTNCRYLHAKSYIAGLAEQTGFVPVRSDEIVVRYQRSQPVAGHLWIMKRAA